MAYPNNQYYNGYFQPQGQMNYYQQPMTMPAPDMLNQYKGQYQQLPQQVQGPQVANDMIWVLGEIEATSYPVAPNATVTLWDKNEQTIYIKSVNAQGVPSMRVLDYKERTAEPKIAPQTNEKISNEQFVSIDEFNALKAKFEALAGKFDEITTTPKTKASKKEAE